MAAQRAPACFRLHFQMEVMVKVYDIYADAAPHAKDNYTSGLKLAEPQFSQFNITGSLRISHFLAQVLYETGAGQVLFENMSYSTPARLLQIFGVGNHSAAITPAEVPGLLHNPVGLAERVYGLGNPAKARELGNVAPGDGYKYRGGGALQTTGRSAYRLMGARIGVDFEANPALIVDPLHIFVPALKEWNDGNLNLAADANDIRKVTRVINGGLNGFADRKRWFATVWKIASAGQPLPAFAAG